MFARRTMPPWLALLTPAFVIIVVVVFVPLLFSLYSSFTPYRLTNPSSLWRWIGVTNYTRILGDGDFWRALGRTVFFLTIVLNLEMILGLGIALLMNTVTRGQRVLRTILMFPMMFSPILVGFQFKFIFNDNIGLVNNALQSSGVSNAALPWLVDGKLAMFSIMFAEIWMSTSVFAILILAGLFAMPRDPLEAAKVDGCTPLQSFRHITLPFLMPFIYIAMTIRSLDVARAYDVVQIMTGGGPANRTELLWTLMTRTAYVDARMGLANAMGYVSIILSIIFTIYFFRKLSAARGQLGMVA
jgi:multiple sugar transport system permease protein